MRTVVRRFAHPLLLASFVFFPVSLHAQEASSPARTATSAGKPANLCQELIAFVRQPDAAVKADATPAALATAVQAPKEGTPAQKSGDGGGEPQENAGLSGQVTSSGPGASGPQGNTQNAAAPSGAAAGAAPSQQGPPSPQSPAPTPAAPATPTAPKPTAEAISEIERAATGNDLAGCRAAGQRMRRAGVAMPAPLVALSPMSLNLLEGADR